MAVTRLGPKTTMSKPIRALTAQARSTGTRPKRSRICVPYQRPIVIEVTKTPYAKDPRAAVAP